MNLRLGFARLPRIGFSVAVVALLAACSVPTHAVTIDLVTVGDPGNTGSSMPIPTPPYSISVGAVADSFQIMKFEFTNQQYKDFLNSVAATDPYSLYNTNMGLARGGITRSGSPGTYNYDVKPNMGDKPVTYVSWFDAARVANWLMNGQGSGDTETGAYTLNGATSGDAVAVNSGATFFIPTSDQWYKAAYYKGGSTDAGYWNYATQSDTAPTAVTADEFGNGSAGSTGNFANYNYGADWDGYDGHTTTVGTNGGASEYGAFDMNGNVREWNDSPGPFGGLAVRGGSWQSSDGSMNRQTWGGLAPSTEATELGFRLASPLVAVPEPSTWVMASAGLACGGWLMLRRRWAR